MALLNITSPHSKNTNTVTKMMGKLLVALVPALMVLTYYFGFGYLINVILASVVAVIAEALVCFLRKRPILFSLKDLSAVVTAVLLALAVPPTLPWWALVTGILFAIVITKHLFGGLGNNPFNPAMAAYAMLLVAFPIQMTQWNIAQDGFTQVAGLIESFNAIFFGTPLTDGFTGATALDTYKESIKTATSSEVLANPIFGQYVVKGWEVVSIAYIVGGLYLLWQRIITWHIPVSLLATLSICALIFSNDADLYTPITLHLFAGATMLGAFFIATDPTSGATSNKGKLIYGAGIGLLIYIIRTHGNFPDAVAFAVLLMNFAAPLIDQYSRPKTYGHANARQGYK